MTGEGPFQPLPFCTLCPRTVTLSAGCRCVAVQTRAELRPSLTALCEEQCLSPALIGRMSSGSRLSLETGNSFASAALESVLDRSVGVVQHSSLGGVWCDCQEVEERSRKWAMWGLGCRISVSCFVSFLRYLWENFVQVVTVAVPLERPCLLKSLLLSRNCCPTSR